MAVGGTINGDLIVLGSVIATGTPQALTRAQLTQATERFKIQPTDWRIWDAFATVLTATANTDDLALVGGTFGTNHPSIQTGDVKAAGCTRYARCTFQLPASYVTGQAVQIRATAGMKTTVAGTSAVIDFEVYRAGDDESIGSDLCATAAQSINNLSDATKDFTITASTLLPGDTLDIRVTITIVDAATATAVIGVMGGCELLLATKG